MASQAIAIRLEPIAIRFSDDMENQPGLHLFAGIDL